MPLSVLASALIERLLCLPGLHYILTPYGPNWVRVAAAGRNLAVCAASKLSEPQRRGAPLLDRA